MKRLILLSLIIFAAGCATVSDIRSTPPDNIMQSEKSPKQIVDCVMYKAPSEVSTAAVPYYNFTLNEQPKGTYHILADIPGQPSGEASFSPLSTGGTHIELRSRWNFWGKEKFWNLIKKCTSHENSPGH